MRVAIVVMDVMRRTTTIAYRQMQASRIRVQARPYSSISQRIRNIPNLFNVIALGGVAITAYGVYEYYSDKRVSPYPPTVRNHLRRALHHDLRGDHNKSVKEFQAALTELDAIAATNENPKAILAEKAGILVSLGDAWEKAGNELYAKRAFKDAYERISDDKRRTTIAVRTGVKLGDMTADLKEKEKYYQTAIDRVMQSMPIENGIVKITADALPKGMSTDELGAAMEALANVYIETGRPTLAIPAYRAAQLAQRASTSSPCRDVVLWVELASAYTALKKNDLQEATGGLSQVDAARDAFQKGLSSYDRIKDRDELCEMAVAEIYLGLGELASSPDEARSWFSKAKTVAKKTNDSERLVKAESYLQTLVPRMR